MTDTLAEIKNLYEIAFDTLNGHNPVPEINVRFYPYVGINHTIRIRNGKVYVRIAELCRQAPLEIHESLAFILVGKLLKKGGSTGFGDLVASGEVDRSQDVNLTDRPVTVCFRPLFIKTDQVNGTGLNHHSLQFGQLDAQSKGTAQRSEPLGHAAAGEPAS